MLILVLIIHVVSPFLPFFFLHFFNFGIFSFFNLHFVFYYQIWFFCFKTFVQQLDLVFCFFHEKFVKRVSSSVFYR